MSKLRWAKFFWNDWASDTALNLCSIPARGLWMALLCIAAQGEPYGTVTIKGRVPTTDELFGLIAPRGTRRRDFDRWLAELETNGVAQRDHRRAIRSPRMSHEGVTSLARIDAARERWKTADNGQSDAGLHMQNDKTGASLHMQSESFASHRVQTQESNTNANAPPEPPRKRGGGRARRSDNGTSEARPSRNSWNDMATDMMEGRETNAGPVEPPPGGARVVSLVGRTVRH
jgi:hypothetical protein